MSKVQYDTFLEMRSYFQSELSVLKDVIPMLIPVDEEDDQAFRLLMNMLDDLNNRMQSATSLSDISDIIDLDALEEDWDDQKHAIMQMTENAKKVINSSEKYWGDEDEMAEAT